MTRELSNVIITVQPASKTADFRLLVSVVNADREIIATIGSCAHNAPKELHALLHAYRMGQRFNEATK